MAEEPDELEVLAEADWLPEGSEEQGSFWRRYLLRQLQRAAGALLIILALSALRSAGPIGEWLLARIGSATKTDFSGFLTDFLQSPGLRNTWAGIHGWFRRELQVGGPTLFPSEKPPILSWPVTGALLLPLGTDTVHAGLDLQVPSGTPIQAAAEGTVAETRQEMDGGITIVLRHGRQWRTVYGRSQAALVRAGENVANGQPIGLVGTAPAPAQSYLHFEFWGPEGPLDPRKYLGTKTSVDAPL